MIIINTMKIIATASEKYLKPTISISRAVEPPNILPSAFTAIIVITEIIAEPAPAHDLASVERFSLSLPPFVIAGIIDQ